MGERKISMNKEKKYVYTITYDNEEPYDGNLSYQWSVAFTSVEVAEEYLYEKGYTRKHTPTPKFMGSETYYTQPLHTREELNELLKLKDKDGENMYYFYDFSREVNYNNETGEWEFLGYRLSGVCTIKALLLLESINELGRVKKPYWVTTQLL